MFKLVLNLIFLSLVTCGFAHASTNTTPPVESRELIWEVDFRNFVYTGPVVMSPESTAELRNNPPHLKFFSRMGRNSLILHFTLTDEPTTDMALTVDGISDTLSPVDCCFDLLINGEFVMDFFIDYARTLTIPSSYFYAGDNVLELRINHKGHTKYMLKRIALETIPNEG